MNGTEWLVEAYGCDPVRLGDRRALENLLSELVRDLQLRVVGTPAWHVFPSPGGVTALYLLAESHLAIHTFPEHGSACLNLFCCKPRPDWPFSERLAVHLGAADVNVRRVEREYSGATIAISK